MKKIIKLFSVLVVAHRLREFANYDRKDHQH